MDPTVIALLEPAVACATMLGVAYGVKCLIWGKGPIRRVRGGAREQVLEQRIAELEERFEQQLSELAVHDAELEERLDFAERVLTQRRFEEPPALHEPRVATAA